jgi:flagellar hook protein FlgE
MSNYTIALSGLQNTSLAIDTTSNNIANANTVGYKAGEYVFADQFVKAVNPADTARVGMGTQALKVRRPMLQGTITNSANPLDLAISGKGMFRLLQGTSDSHCAIGTTSEQNGASDVDCRPNVDPSGVYYTRNGQFGLDKNGYIVTENGMYLTGYQASPDGTCITDDRIKNCGLLKMPESNLPGNETSASVISAMLDSRGSAFTSNANVSFDPTQSTFNNKTSQTVFDNDGNSHTLEVYYRRVSDASLPITSGATGYTYSPGPSSTPNTLGATLVTINPNSVLRVDTPATANSQAASASASTTITLTANAANVNGMRVFINGVDSGATVLSGGSSSSLTTTSAVLVPAGAAVSFYAPTQTNTATAVLTNAATFTTSSAIAGASVGDRIFVKGIDTGKTVTGISGTTITTSAGGITTTNIADAITFFKSNLDMTLMTPDGTEITVQGFGNKKNSGEVLTTNMAKVEVYASIDGRFFDYNDATTTSNRALTPQTPGVLGYKAVSEMRFIGGHNIDSLVSDPASGNPLFKTATTLSTRVTNQAGGSSSLVIDLDLSDTSLEAGAFQITHSTQNGEPLARLTNVTVDNEGRIVGVYGSGKQQFVGQIALVHFDNAEGLIPVGKNAFAASVDSGTEDSACGVVVGRAGTGVFGDIKGQALESSTVDLANELVRLMVLQRSYSANSQSMKAFDQTLRDTLQMVG